MRKERFPTHRRSKLHPRGDDPFQFLERINDNAYKLDLPSKYNISATFNISDLSPFDVGDDSRMNLKENLVLYPIQNSQRKRHSWIYFIHD